MDFKKGSIMFLLGAILIYFANVARIGILSTIYFTQGSDVFEKYHLFIWNFVSGIYVALVWIFLTIKFKLKEIPMYSDIKYLYEKSLFKKN